MTSKFTKAARLLAWLLALVMSLAAFAACDNGEEQSSAGGTQQGGEVEHVDYVADLKLDMSTNTKKQEVTVKSYIDGDTTHFHISDSTFETGVMKARYLAINTPESTGKIEEWGKAASNFTKETLKKATSIIVESDDDKWNADSTGDRYLVWVWYKTAEDTEYRNLNLEILQEGLAVASNSNNNRYGDTCMKAIAQAKAEKLRVYSNEKDPDFFYGESTPMTLKELRLNIKEYTGMKVAFEGVVTKNAGQAVYVEEYDPETDMYFGVYVYYGFNMVGEGLSIISTVGNRVRVVGSVQYYETGDSYQVSGLSYSAFADDESDNLQLISTGHKGAFVEIEPATFKGDVSIEVGEEMKTFKFAELALGTSVSMKDLQVVSIYTTTNEDSASKGAMTLTCKAADGTTIAVRTDVLRDSEGNLITEDTFTGKTIDVRGLVDYFTGDYQIKVYTINDVTIHA
jgi:endonuclease YncB( thermonuclease family)